VATRLPLDADEVPGFAVRSAFIVYRNQGDRTDDLWAGAREDVLLEGGPAGFLVRQRTIRLDQAVISAKSVSVFF
jgi:3-phenylpropionate/cinnamic acid dioxygenase small subunit